MRKPVVALLALGLGMLAQARAGEALALRMQVNTQHGGNQYALVAAERGQFPVTRTPSVPRASDLLVVGRSADGRELFRVRVADPAVLHAEAFDPHSGQIAFAGEVRRPRTAFEVRVPEVQGLDHLELRRADLPATARGLGQRIAVSRVNSLLRGGRGKQGQQVQAERSVLLHESGSAAQRMDIVLIGDGYTRAEMGKWAADARKVADGLLADPLFAANRQRFNLRRVDVASAQSGVSEPDRGIYRNTALGTQAGCSGIARLVCADTNAVFSTVGSVLAADARDVVVVVANTTRYGGAGGTIATMTMHAAAIELALHEIGHTAFDLADEYDYGSCYNQGEPGAANVTRQTSRSYIKWHDLIAGSVPLPTPVGRYAAGTVGLFEGGNYCTRGVYRPTENSRMRALGYPWYAVNERRANQEFARYAGNPDPTDPPQPDPDGTTVTGYLSGTGQFADHPDPYRQLAAGGRIRATLQGPSGADFELHLYRWNGRGWSIVARSESPTSNEAIDYNASPGYYTIEVFSYRGSGNYQLTYSLPE